MPAVVRLILAALLAVAGFSPVPAASYNWNAVAVGGGGFVSGILYHPTVNGLVYARTDVGGAYRWDGTAGRWIALNDDIGGLNNEFMNLGVASFAVDANDADRLYLACGQYTQWWAPNAILLRSADRGATWSRTALPFKLGGNEDGRNTGERLAVDPNRGDILFLGTNANGLWKSTDRGVTWTQVTSFTPVSCTLVLFDRSTGSAGNPTQTIFVGVNTTSASSLYRSTDGGTTWAAVPGQPTGLLPHHADLAHAGGTRTLYLAYSNALGPNGASAGAVWKLDLAGGTWTNITPVSGSWGYGGLSVDASNPSTVVCSTIDRWGPRDEIYRSTNGGASWTPVLQPATLDHAQAPWAAASTPHWTCDVRIDPFNSNRAMFVTGYGLFATTNLAATTPVWSFFNEGLEETAVLGIISPPAGASMLSALGDIDGFRHESLTVEPTSRLTPLQGTNTSIEFAGQAPAKMVRAFNGGTRGAYSNDGGGTWTNFAAAAAPSANGGVITISADGATIVWSQENTAARRSTNNGASWSACAGVPSSSSATYAPIADRVNAARFYLYDHSAGRIYTSADSGASFSAAATVPAGGSRPVAVPGFEGHLWIPCWNSGLRRSTDAGASFSTLASVQEGYAVGFGKPATGQTYPAVFIWGKVAGVVGLFRSDDTGANWVRINDDRHQYGYITTLAGDPRVFGRVYLASSGRGVVAGEPASAIPTLPNLPATAWAPFTSRTAGSYSPGVTIPPGVTFSATGLPAWASLNPATGAITGTPPVDAGAVYQVTLRAIDAGGDAVTSTVNLLIAAPGSDLRFLALSTRAQVLTGANILIPGIAVIGDEPRPFLVRAVGPSLAGAPYNVGGSLADPTMVLRRYGVDGVLAANDNWGASADLAAINAAVGRTGLNPVSPDSKDAALIASLGGGAYTITTEGVAGGTGVALLEIYDASPAGPSNSTYLFGIAARAMVGTGGDILIPGVVLQGGGSKRILVRARGPGLGFAGVLADPELKLFSISGPTLATNDDWENSDSPAEIQDLSQRIGSPLSAGSKDAALVARLTQGIYTLHISGKNNGTGVALVELYLFD